MPPKLTIAGFTTASKEVFVVIEIIELNDACRPTSLTMTQSDFLQPTLLNGKEHNQALDLRANREGGLY